MSKSKKDVRYEAVKQLIQTGNLTSLQAAFQIIPVTVVKADAGFHYATLHRKIYQPSLFKVEEIIILANLFNVSPQEILGLALTDLKYKATTVAKKNTDL
ncbi:hypothetical protein ACDQ55_16055 [Chitinophaga sp. 30R24]|uniref:hypothetical protein n=1 Tax=Chitinophaga sp. 30R24 TaxID=3248838 RepID=UPI003B91E317